MKHKKKRCYVETYVYDSWGNLQRTSFCPEFDSVEEARDYINKNCASDLIEGWQIIEY